MFKIGYGYDLHKLVFKKPLILCGVKIPFKKGLLGHSDADVATHALIDSLLGAMGIGDIGCFFPDNNPKYKNICSLTLLQKTVSLLEQKNFKISNIDITIVAQSPKISPFYDDMKNNLKNILKIKKEQISVKSTTEEKKGITKNGRSIAAFCCCLIFNSL